MQQQEQSKSNSIFFTILEKNKIKVFLHIKKKMDFDYPEIPQEEKKPLKVTGKKRKIDDPDIKERAKSLCRDAEEWSSVCKMSTKQLQGYVDRKEFENNANLRNSVFDGLHRAYAFIADKLSAGDGYVQEQMLSDVSLRESIENEAIPLFKYLNNKAKIAFLTGNNVVQGKIKQRIEAPVIEEIFSDSIINGEEQNESCEGAISMGSNEISVMGEGEAGFEEGETVLSEEDRGEILGAGE